MTKPRRPNDSKISRYIEEENRKMEEKLNELRERLAREKAQRLSQGSFWKHGSSQSEQYRFQQQRQPQKQTAPSSLPSKIPSKGASSSNVLRTDASLHDTPKTNTDQLKRIGPASTSSSSLQNVKNRSSSHHILIEFPSKIPTIAPTSTSTSSSSLKKKQPKKETKETKETKELKENKPSVIKSRFATEPIQEEIKSEQSELVYEPLEDDFQPTEQSYSNRLLDGDFDESGGHEDFLSALNEWRNAGKTNTKESTGTSQETVNQTNQVGDLLSGTYNEKKAEKEFQEALMEWRRDNSQGNSSQKPVESANASTGDAEGQYKPPQMAEMEQWVTNLNQAQKEKENQRDDKPRTYWETITGLRLN